MASRLSRRAWGTALRGTLALAAAGALSAGLAVGPAGAATPQSYVALGDSYTAGAGILPLSSAPLECLQSTLDYPHLVAGARGWAVNDVSCSGATSGNMTSAQYPGVAPQFNALSTSTTVVTVGIGGNDNNLFLGALVSCGITDIADFLNIGAPCKALFGNSFANDVTADAPTIAGVLSGIHARSPHAQVFMVGYPDILPQSGNCYPTMPLTTEDVAYLNALEQDLNAMLGAQAAAGGATFVNTYTPTVGHDACKSSSVRWVNPIIATNGGISVHPDPAGEAAMAAAVESALASKGL